MLCPARRAIWAGGGPGVQPQGQGGVPQVVGAASESRGSCRGPEGQTAGGVPGAAVAAFAERAAAGTHGTGGHQVRCRSSGGDGGAWRPGPAGWGRSGPIPQGTLFVFSEDTRLGGPVFCWRARQDAAGHLCAIAVGARLAVTRVAEGHQAVRVLAGAPAGVGLLVAGNCGYGGLAGALPGSVSPGAFIMPASRSPSSGSAGHAVALSVPGLARPASASIPQELRSGRPVPPAAARFRLHPGPDPLRALSRPGSGCGGRTWCSLTPGRAGRSRRDPGSL